MKIVIPSLGRYDNVKTLSQLRKLECDIYLFVVEEEYLFYEKNYSNYCKIIIGKHGLKEQRNFITNYFDEGEILVCMDDDIDQIYQDLSIELPKAIEYLSQSNLGLMTFNPTNMYMARTTGYKEGCYFGIGTFHILKNHRDFQLKYNQGDDFERSILYLKIYGKNIRNFNIYFKSKYTKNKGGFQRNIPDYVNETNRLAFEYRDYICFKDKKLFNTKLGNLNLKKNTSSILQLGYYNCFENLYYMFEKVKLKARKTSNNRLGFPEYRGAIFGLTRPRFRYKGYLELSLDSKTHPLIYDEIMRIGKLICPFEFNSIQVNKNLVCPPHKDKKNVGLSMLVSFGEYEGCNIVVNNKKYDANCRPVIFNGAELEHYNTNDLVGTKYSLVYFTNP